MAEPYTRLPPSRPALKVHFYGADSFKTESLAIDLEPPRSYEDVLAQCSQHLSHNLGRYFPRQVEKTIGPLLLPMFGLYAKDHSLQQWVGDWYVFDSNNDGQEFYFRVKVRLSVTNKFAEKIPRGVFSEYLFWQCADDFLRGRVWQLFEKDNKINSIDAVNFNALHILMASAQYSLHGDVTGDTTRVLHTPLKDMTKVQKVLQKLKVWNLMQYFPDRMSPELHQEYNLRRDLFLRWISYRFLRKYVRQFFDINGGQSISELRLMFVDSFLREYVLSYGLEFFSAEKVDKPGLPPTPVELIIRPYQDGCSPGLYFNKKLVAPLQDILRVDIQESESSRADQKCTLFLEFRNLPPLFLLMASREFAESFVSLLDLYCRLKVNYHISPRDDDQWAPTLRVLNMLRSYGPMPEEVARDHLQKRRAEDRQTSDVPHYMIYQDCEQFGLLHLLGVVDHFIGYDIRFKPAAESESGFTFTLCEPERSEAVFETTDPKRLAFHVSELMLGQRVIPREGELCGAMYFLTDENSDYRYYTELPNEHELHRRKAETTSDVPRLYREHEVTVSDDDHIAKGQFSEVYRITQMEQERKAILKKVTSTDPAVQEAHRKGAERLTKLREGCRLFIRVYGTLWSSPLRVILESMPQGKGTLLCRLRDTSAPPFTWPHVSSVLRQLASCLDYLAERGLIYGSFCCAKILILSEKEDTNEDQNQTLVIRMGDPSVAVYLDTLPCSHPLNVDRLAWVAPERFLNLGQNSVATEVYAFGTTLWEMINLGKRPNDCVPSTCSVADFFARNQKLPTDFLAPTTVTEDENHHPGRQAVPQARESVHSQNSQQHSDVTDYMTAGICSSGGDSGTRRAQTATDGNQEAAAKENVPLQQLKSTIVNLIHACWLRNPSMRPSPREIRQKALAVGKHLMEAISVDSCWQHRVFLEQALKTGNVNNPDLAQQQIEQLQGNLRVGQSRQQTEEQERMERLQEEARNNITCTIMASRLDFEGSRELGKGHFGCVVTALLSPESETRQEEESCTKEKVAVKMINSNEHKPEEVSQFLREALCIFRLNHPNVVKLIGFVPRGRDNPNQLVMEYADMGSLEGYVHKNAPKLGTSPFKLLLRKLLTDIAKGMQYVCQEVNRVHGDLAARNVLLFSQGRNSLTAKLCDFGLSHQLNRGYYDLLKSSSKKMPAYLFPPETLKGLKFTIETDIWSYGILLWEVFSNQKPDDVLGKTISDILSKYNNYSAQRHPLTKPVNCPPRMYDIMKDCWEAIPERRPRFDKLVKSLEELTDHDME
ncbi:uncharacterized protein LOC143284540 isoform X2 [Babylonia areolata]